MKIKLTLTKSRVYSKEDAQNKVSGMKLHENNTVVECDLETFVQYLENKHSFYPAATDPTVKTTITHEAFVSTDLLVADVDHADFTVDDILKISNEHGLNVAVIYESLSSTDKKHKYRVLYQIDRLTDKEAFIKAQKFLIYVFGMDYVDKVVVDTGCFDPGRIYYTAKKVVYQNDVMTDIQAVLNRCEALDIEAVHKKMVEINAPLKKEEKDRKKAEKEALKAQAPIEYSEELIIDLDPIDLSEEDFYREMFSCKVVKRGKSYELTSRDLAEVAEMIVNYLQELKQSTELPKHLDVNEIKDWVSHNIHLTDALQLPSHQTFSCIFHEDENPSAAIVDNGETEGYHCHSCGKTWTTFAFIQEVFAREFNQTVHDTEKFICTMLGIKYGSDYQLNVIDQLNNNNLKIIRKITALDTSQKINSKTDDQLKADIKIAKKLKRNGSLAILKAFVEIALEQSLLAPVTKEDDKNSSHVFVSIGFLQKWLMDSGVTYGMKNLEAIRQKVISLCEYGLLERIDFDDIRDSKLQNVLDVRQRAVSYKNEVLKQRIRKNEELIEISDHDYKMVYYYKLPFWSEEHFTRMLEILNRYKDCGKKVKGNNKKRLHGVDRAKADSIFLQTDVEYSKKDLYFIKTVSKFIDEAIETNGWFDLKGIKKAIKRKNMTASERNKAIDDLLPGIVDSKGIKKVRISKALRSEFGIPEKIKTSIYILK